ncbi:MAG: diacylglycerol kinase family protein [Deltaproteobacteria bacterium]|nr:diacylglycerol kinase family protein [Deltaproteobacteria bacterium]
MARTSTVSVLPPRSRSGRTPTPQVAVLLNANARAVNPRVVRAISEVVPSRDLFLSHTFGEARQIASEVIGRGYDTVLTGGGDGTFVGFYNAMQEVRGCGAATTRGPGGALVALQAAPMPRMGALRLGTGNAIAGYTGAGTLRGAGVQSDILRARAGRLEATRRMDLVQVEGTYAPFSGVGLDALILNNYIRWKKILGMGPLKFLGEGLLGYLLSVGALSVPEALLRSMPELEIVNTGDDAIPVNTRGEQIGAPVPHGAVIYRGPARIASVGTCPYYGLDFKIFPAADCMPGRMQLRVADISVPSALWNLPAIWRGIYNAPTVRDYMVTSVSIRSDAKMPFQIGGDAQGWRDSVEFGVADQPAELLDFSRPQLTA